MSLPALHIRLHDNLASIVCGSLNLHELRGLAILVDHLHRSVARLDQLAELHILAASARMGCLDGVRNLLALGGGHELICVDELGMTVVGDDHLRCGRLNGLLIVNVVDVVRIVMDVLTKRLLDLQLLLTSVCILINL